MGHYLTADEIKQNKEYIYKNVNEKQNYFIRQGIIKKLLLKYSLKEGTIVELGAGSGRLAKELVGEGYKNIHLIDIDNYLVGEFPPDIVSFHQLDLAFNKLPFTDNSVDAVLAIAVLEHLENPALVVREAARVLKSGGVFIAAIPWIFSLRSKILFLTQGNLKGYNEQNNHISLFTRATFSKIFLKYFDLLDVKYSEGYFQISNQKIILGWDYPWFKRLFADKVFYVLKKKRNN